MLATALHELIGFYSMRQITWAQATRSGRGRSRGREREPSPMTEEGDSYSSRKKNLRNEQIQLQDYIISPERLNLSSLIKSDYVILQMARTRFYVFYISKSGCEGLII